MIDRRQPIVADLNTEHSVKYVFAVYLAFATE